jgi:hypothetical protein
MRGTAGNGDDEVVDVVDMEVDVDATDAREAIDADDGMGAGTLAVEYPVVTAGGGGVGGDKSDLL